MALGPAFSPTQGFWVAADEEGDDVWKYHYVTTPPVQSERSVLFLSSELALATLDENESLGLVMGQWRGNRIWGIPISLVHSVSVELLLPIDRAGT